MEDDKGLDLSLGLPFCGSSSKMNEKVDASSNDTDRTSKILNDFRNFLNGGIPQQGYLTSLPSSAIIGHSSEDGNARRFHTSPSTTERVIDVEDEKGPMIGDKRKNLCEEVNTHKKQETGAQNSDLHDNAGTSHISITTDDGSTADNEDVAESVSEASRLAPNTIEESSKQQVNARPGKVTNILPPFSLQSASSLKVPCSITFKGAAPVGAPSMAGVRTQAMNAGNTHMMFGYAHGQLPLMDKDHPWGMISRPPVLHPYSDRPLSAPATNHELSQGEHPAVKECSSQAEDNVKMSNTSAIFRGNSTTEIRKDNSIPSEYPSIRPGMAADLNFGGSGLLPNLPWVSTTGPGPNGRTISGVTYRFSENQIKIVCACHGLHMSPEDFIQHASDEPPSATDTTAAATSSDLASYLGTSNAAALAKS